MASTTMVTTPKSSSQNTLDNQKKITENEQIPNSNTATSAIDELLKTALGGKKLNLLSPKELNELLDKVNFLDAIGLDTEGKQIPNKGNNQKSSPASALTSGRTSTRTSTRTSSSASTVSLPDLVGSFGTINLPTTVDFGATGSAQVIVTNQGQALASGPSTV
nr:phosphoesterase [Microcystis aeruginosa LG13-11]